jgi:hypothetical protein
MFVSLCGRLVVAYTTLDGHVGDATFLFALAHDFRWERDSYGLRGSRFKLCSHFQTPFPVSGQELWLSKQPRDPVPAHSKISVLDMTTPSFTGSWPARANPVRKRPNRGEAITLQESF